ncbi:hypothetical protein LTR08_006459 [Meristemomyces frigidus]|nr:hypothetical protein LTR08_006459 [Meristemomyces frigidus]
MTALVMTSPPFALAGPAGKRGPPINTLFDDSPPAYAAGRSTKLQDLLEKGTFPNSEHGTRYRHHSTIEEEDSVPSTPVRSARERRTGSTGPGAQHLFTASPPTLSQAHMADLDELDWDAPESAPPASPGRGIQVQQFNGTPTAQPLEKSFPFRLGSAFSRSVNSASALSTPSRYGLGGSDRPNPFDWSEQQPSPSHQNQSPPRPRTVHGKKDPESRGSRPAGRRPASGMHARSQSVPVVPDVEKRSVVANKFGTWGVGSKGVTEDWNEDFDFDEAPQPVPQHVGQDEKRIDSGHEMFVPRSIREQQENVVANISLLREWGLLIEELKDLRIRAVALDMLAGPYASDWQEVDAMIELADQESEEETLQPRRSPPSSPGMDFDVFEEMPLSTVTFTGRRRGSTVVRLIEPVILEEPADVEEPILVKEPMLVEESLPAELPTLIEDEPLLSPVRASPAQTLSVLRLGEPVLAIDEPLLNPEQARPAQPGAPQDNDGKPELADSDFEVEISQLRRSPLSSPRLGSNMSEWSQLPNGTVASDALEQLSLLNVEIASDASKEVRSPSVTDANVEFQEVPQSADVTIHGLEELSLPNATVASDAIEETRENITGRPRGSTVVRLTEPALAAHDLLLSPGPVSPTQHGPPPLPSFSGRPRKNSGAVARTVIEALQTKRSVSDPTALKAAQAAKKVPFDTATLRHIVPYVNGLKRKVKDAIREKEGLYSSPSRVRSPPDPTLAVATYLGEPHFRSIFNEPQSESTVPKHRLGRDHAATDNDGFGDPFADQLVDLAQSMQNMTLRP